MRYILLESPKIRFVERLPGSEAICHQSPQAPVNRQAPEEPVNRQSPGDRLEMNCPQHYRAQGKLDACHSPTTPGKTSADAKGQPSHRVHFPPLNLNQASLYPRHMTNASQHT